MPLHTVPCTPTHSNAQPRSSDSCIHKRAGVKPDNCTGAGSSGPSTRSLIRESSHSMGPAFTNMLLVVCSQPTLVQGVGTALTAPWLTVTQPFCSPVHLPAKLGTHLTGYHSNGMNAPMNRMYSGQSASRVNAIPTRARMYAGHGHRPCALATHPRPARNPPAPHSRTPRNALALPRGSSTHPDTRTRHCSPARAA